MERFMTSARGMERRRRKGKVLREGGREEMRWRWEFGDVMVLF
jgi:hypothetical protein